MTKEEKAAYDKIYRAKNADRISKYKIDWYWKNIERYAGYKEKRKERYKNDPDFRRKALEKYHQWCAANPEKTKEIYRRSYLNNKPRKQAYSAWYVRKFNWKVNASTMKRIAKKKMATPKWADQDAIEAVYKKASEMSKRDGIKYHVDHIYPLQGRTVTGLHTHTNLQILTASENCRKGNRAWI